MARIKKATAKKAAPKKMVKRPAPKKQAPKEELAPVPTQQNPQPPMGTPPMGANGPMMRKGGKIKKSQNGGKHKMPDGSMMKNSAMKSGGKMKTCKGGC